MQIRREGRSVTLRSLLSPKYPASVMVPSAITRAIVPASVDSNPPLYVPRDSLDDITRERSAKFTPGSIQSKIHHKCNKKKFLILPHSVSLFLQILRIYRCYLLILQQIQTWWVLSTHIVAPYRGLLCGSLGVCPKEP